MSILQAYYATLGGAGTAGSGGVILADQTLYDYNGGSASVGYQLSNTGDIYWLSSTISPIDLGDWVSPKSLAPGSYEVFAELGPASLGTVTGPLGSWVALTTTRTWTLDRAFPGASGAQINIQIRLGGTVLTSATITLQVEAY